jgi:hypothetical protein
MRRHFSARARDLILAICLSSLVLAASAAAALADSTGGSFPK